MDLSIQTIQIIQTPGITGEHQVNNPNVKSLVNNLQVTSEASSLIHCFYTFHVLKPDQNWPKLGVGIGILILF